MNNHGPDKKLPSSTGAEEGEFGRKNAISSPPTSAGSNCLDGAAFHHTLKTRAIENRDGGAIKES
jgi:hypothetical protein